MADATSSSPPPQKLSRYRSQRRPQSSSAHEPPGTPQVLPHESSLADDSVSRSKSRYRRKNAGATSPPPDAWEQEQIRVPLRPQTSRDSPQKRDHEAPPVQGQRKPFEPEKNRDRTTSPTAQLGAQGLRRVRSEDVDSDAEDERRQRLYARYSVKREQEPLSPPLPAKSGFHGQQPSGELFPPPRPEPVKSVAKAVVVDGAPTSDKIRATKSMSALPKYSDDEDEGGGCFGLFKRKRGEAAPQAEKTPIARPMTGREPPTIKPGGGGVVPGTDAPISAVNAGDRKVLVECGKSKTIFPVTPTTTTVDIIKSATTCMSERIDVKSAVLLESFGTVGVQRPLRRYEHLRDVMNSWDTDRQNSLLLFDPGTGSSEAELSLSGVPRQKPADESWLLSFSQKVGKWDKRLITLRSDGQITMQKDPRKPQDQVNVCHLSDFDIYTPTQEKLKKKVKPPKKICYAIKSQRKTSMFESTHNFVHFFCTSDRPTADAFYAAVQGWRSWYLVNVMGEGRKAQSPERQLSATEKEFGGREKGSGNHLPGSSMDSNYHICSFKPLMDIDQFEKQRPGTSRSVSREAMSPSSTSLTKSANQFDTTVSPERRTSTQRKKQQQQRPPGSMRNRAQLADDEPLVNLERRASVDRQRRPSLDQTRSNSGEFASTALLGRSYSQRQRDYAERENAKQQIVMNGAYEKEDNLLHEYSPRRSLDGGPRRTHSTRVQQQAPNKTTNSGDLHRSTSRAKESPFGKPLVDLTPQYREPPQHANKSKGKGYNPDAIGPGGLIDAATSPEDPLGIPPSTDWRGRNAQQSPQHDMTPHRSPSLNRPAAQRPSTGRPSGGASAFTGEGLLAGSQAQSGWGGGERGRGVMDGSRARGPMVDLSEPSKFVQGSLLNKAEREGGGGVIKAPVIDRSGEED